MTRSSNSATWMAFIGAEKWGGQSSMTEQIIEAIENNDPSWPITPTESDSEYATLAHVLLDNWPTHYEADTPLARLITALHGKGVDFSLKDTNGATAVDVGRELALQNISKAWFQTRTVLHAIKNGWKQNPRREEVARLLGVGSQKVLAKIPSTPEQWREKIDGVDLGQWVFLHMFDGMQWGLAMRSLESSCPAWDKIEEDRQKDFNALITLWKRCKYDNPDALTLARWGWQALESARPRTRYNHTNNKSLDAFEASRKHGKGLIEGMSGLSMDTDLGGNIPLPKGHPLEEMAHTLRYAALARGKNLSTSGWRQVLESQERSQLVQDNRQEGKQFLITYPFETLDRDVLDAITPPTQKGAHFLLQLRANIHKDDDRYEKGAAWFNEYSLAWMKSNDIAPDPEWWSQCKMKTVTNKKHDQKKERSFDEAVDLLISTPQSNFTAKRPRL